MRGSEALKELLKGHKMKGWWLTKEVDPQVIQYF